MSNIYLIEIETLNTMKEWEYEPLSRIIIPVKSNNYSNAQAKFQSKCSGSQFPHYRVINVTKCDTFLFKPIL